MMGNYNLRLEAHYHKCKLPHHLFVKIKYDNECKFLSNNRHLYNDSKPVATTTNSLKPVSFSARIIKFAKKIIIVGRTSRFLCYSLHDNVFQNSASQGERCTCLLTN